jgi:hypothetical protein
MSYLRRRRRRWDPHWTRAGVWGAGGVLATNVSFQFMREDHWWVAMVPYVLALVCLGALIREVLRTRPA